MQVSFKRFPQPPNDRIYSVGVRPSRLEVEHWTTLAQSRFLPPGSDRKAALDTHRDTLSKQPEVQWTSQQEELVDVAIRRLRGWVPGWKNEPSPHLSISNSACFECSRKDGGKTAYVTSQVRKFLTDSNDHLLAEEIV